LRFDSGDSDVDSSQKKVSILGATVEGLPVGLSILGGPGTDATLVATAASLVAE
jgi:amidase